MNPFLEEDDASIPLKASNYSNYSQTMDDNMNPVNNQNNNDDDYGTFNGKKPVRSGKHRNGQSIQKAAAIPSTESSAKTPTPIRTDKVTGNRYLRLRSVGMDEDRPGSVLNYEKEVYNSLVRTARYTMPCILTPTNNARPRTCTLKWSPATSPCITCGWTSNLKFVSAPSSSWTL